MSKDDHDDSCDDDNDDDTDTVENHSNEMLHRFRCFKGEFGGGSQEVNKYKIFTNFRAILSSVGWPQGA